MDGVVLSLENMQFSLLKMQDLFSKWLIFFLSTEILYCITISKVCFFFLVARQGYLLAGTYCRWEVLGIRGIS